jgi:hypothetical protein
VYDGADGNGSPWEVERHKHGPDPAHFELASAFVEVAAAWVETMLGRLVPTYDYDAGDVVTVRAWDEHGLLHERRVEAPGVLTGKVQERGNGFPEVGDFVAGADGDVYRVQAFEGPIHTGPAGSPNWLWAKLAPALWCEVTDDTEPKCTVVLEDDGPPPIVLDDEVAEVAP